MLQLKMIKDSPARSCGKYLHMFTMSVLFLHLASAVPSGAETRQ